MKYDRLFQDALRNHQADNLAAAEYIYRRLLALQPNHARALYLLGTLLAQKGCPEAGVPLLQKAVHLKPELGEAHNNLGNIFAALGRLDEAVSSYRRALEIRADNPEALCNLGAVLHRQGDLEGAEAGFQRALAYRPDYPEACVNLGNLLQERGELESAADCYERAIAIRADNPEALYNLGTIQQALGRLKEAERSLCMALEFRPRDPEIHNNLGIVLQKQGRTDHAIARYRQALAIEPTFEKAWTNLGTAFQALNRLEEAHNAFARALTLQPDEPTAHWNRALLWLLQGDYTRGWSEYEWGLRSGDRKVGEIASPAWDGSNFGGRTLLVRAEQGYGDTFQFVRFLPFAKARGGQVVFESPPELTTVLQRCPGVDHLVAQRPDGPPTVPFDLQVPLLSLPARLGATLANLPADVPYIQADPERVERWRARIESPSKLRVGIVWAGNPAQKNDRSRSCTLDDFAPLAQAPGVTFFSLQKGGAAGQASDPPAGMTLCDLRTEIADFADTAAIISHLDLVVSVCTSVAHLAGAMGKPVWTLLAYAADWRWLMERADSPWYPTMRLFRQSSPGDWPSVFTQVAEALSELSA